MAADKGVIRWDDHTHRWEFWYQSRCHAYSNSRGELEREYPDALVQELVSDKPEHMEL